MWEALAVANDRKPKEPQGLPEGWKWVRLGEVIEEVKEKVGNKYLEPVAIGIQGVKKRSEIYYKDLAEDYSKNKVFKSGNVAFGLGSNEMAIGVNTSNQDYCISPAYRVFKLKEQDVLYFHYFLSFFKKVVGDKFLILSARQGKAVDFERLFNEYIPLPPLPEQRKIAQILETVDNAIEKTEKIIEKYKRIKQGLMQDLLTKGIDENGNIRSEKTHKFKDSPLGRIPEEWEVVRLGEVIHSFAGGTPSREIPEFYNGGIKWLKSGEINRKYIYFTEETLSPKGLKSSNAKWVPENTIVIAMYGATAGQIGIIKDRMTTNQAVLALVIIDERKVFYEYLYYSLSKFVSMLLSNLQGSGQPNLSKNIIDSLLIPLPPLSEQKRIAEILSQIDQAIEKEEKYKEKLERLKKGLMEDLLTGKVRVNRLVEGENHEMA
jgi:type I restriction enzyme S subunit